MPPNYQAPQQPTMPPPPPVSPIPQPPQQQPHRNTKKPLIALIVVGILTAIICATVYFLVSIDDEKTSANAIGSCPLRGSAAEASIFNFGHCDMDEVNASLANKDLSKLTAPDLTPCAPSNALHGTDREGWLVAWGNCLNQQWKPVLQAQSDFTDPGLPEPVRLVESLAAAESRCAKGGEHEDMAGGYCQGDETIYIIASHGGTIESDAETLFHEYAHHLQHQYGIQIDSRFFVQELYKHRGDSQEISEVEAAQHLNRRKELNAICAAAVMLTRTAIDTEKAANRSLVASGYLSHGSEQAQLRAVNRGLTANGEMSACNTWSWPSSEIDQ